MLKALHDGAGGGHLGVHKTLVKARERFYWPGLRKDVEDWCQQCGDCAESKNKPVWEHLKIACIEVPKTVL